jgi:ribokinase
MSKVIVAGSINMDIVVTAERHPRVGETIVGQDLRYFPGGKGANQAVAAAKLGGEVQMVGRVGSDAFAGDLDLFLKDQAVDLSYVSRTASAPTGTALITVASADNTIVVVPGANGTVSESDVSALPIDPADVLVSQFEIPVPAVTAFFRNGKTSGARTILNPAPAQAIPTELIALVDVLVVNETELDFLVQAAPRTTVASPTQIVDSARALREKEDQWIIVTLGADGAVALIGNKVLTIPGRKVTAVDTTGAGDCFVGALAAELAAGSDAESALNFANSAASICVQRPGAGPSMPTRNETLKAS